MEGISIIISAKNAKEFVKECLDSIEKQTYKNYEILLGVDNCEETWRELQLIRCIDENSNRLHTYFFSEHYGLFVVRNTLATLAKYDYLTFFDIDDIMFGNFLDQIDTVASVSDIVKTSATTIPHKNRVANKSIIGIHKDKFFELGGYRPWKCAADDDFLRRAIRADFQIANIVEPTMYRRMHSNNLSESKEMGVGTEYRKKLKESVNPNEIKIELVTGKYTRGE